jgi:hypothetical protein
VTSVPPMELEQAWSRMAVKRATVKRVMGTLVSVTFDDYTEAATFRAPSGVALSVGMILDVAGDATFQRRLKVCAIAVSDQRAWVDRDFAAAKWFAAPLPPPGPPAFLPVLVEHGLLDSVSQVTPDCFGRDAQSLLVDMYSPRGALDRGFVHWDHRWRNDTDDPIADLAQIVRAPELHAIRLGTTFRFSFERLAHEVFDADDLDEVGIAVDRWLSRELTRPRLFAWVKGDRHVFLARPLEQGLALARALDDPDLVLASAEPTYGGI